MYLKHIKELIIETLKYFFNFDRTFCNQFFLIALVLFSLLQLFCTQLKTEIYNGLLTVKEDALMLRDQIDAAMQRFEHNISKHAITNILKLHTSEE